MQTYKIIRFHRSRYTDSKIIKTGLTLEQAQEHCQREDTHEQDRQGVTIWFDGYTKE